MYDVNLDESCPLMFPSQPARRIILLTCTFLISALLVTILLIPSSSRAQNSRTISFSDFGDNPVIGPFDDSDWEIDRVYSPQIIQDNDQWYAFFLASFEGSDATGIGLATSEDGLTWIPASDNPIYETSRFQPINDFAVFKTDETWSIYLDGIDSATIRKISSSDLSDGWINEGDITLESPTWYLGTIAPSSIVKNDDTYFLYYTAMDDLGLFHIGLLTSDDASTWTDFSSSVFDPSVDGWDSGGIQNASVWYSSQVWEMFYTGLDANGKPAGIGYATSLDGSEWIRFPTPIFEPANDDNTMLTSSIVVQDDTYYLYYDHADAINLVIGQSTDESEVVAEGSPTAFGEETATPELPNPVEQTFLDEEGDTISCVELEASLDSEVDISQIVTQQADNNIFTIEVHLVAPLVTDFSFAVLAITREGEQINYYLWQVHNEEFLIGAFNPDTGDLLEVQSTALIDYNLSTGIATFILYDVNVDEIAIRSLHTPDAETEPQPSTCDNAGPFIIE